MPGLTGRFASAGSAWLLAAGVPAIMFVPGSPAAPGRAAVTRPQLPAGSGIYRPRAVRLPPARAWVPPGMLALAPGATGRIQARRAVTAGGLQGVLNAITAVRSADVWAVGLRCAPPCLDAERTLIRHWNGRVWSTVPSPNPSPTNDQLFAVSADSARDAWAVGDRFRQVAPGTQAGATLALHWNGRVWSKVASPPAGTDATTLYGVSALTPTNAWAVGEDDSAGSGRTLTLILHWNGRAWSRVASPNPSNVFSSLTGVRVVTAGNAWAVGRSFNLRTGTTETLLVHWNGRAWSRVPSPNPSTAGNGLFAVSARSASDVWAAGGFCAKFCGGTAEVDDSLLLHWNGRAWSRVPSPNPGVLFTMSARSAANAWAAGSFCSHQCNQDGEIDRSVTMHWNGRAWSKVPVPHPDTRYVAGISTVSQSRAWAVGSSCGTTCQALPPTNRPLILHWNGSTWSAA